MLTIRLSALMLALVLLLAGSGAAQPMRYDRRSPDYLSSLATRDQVVPSEQPNVDGDETPRAQSPATPRAQTPASPRAQTGFGDHPGRPPGSPEYEEVNWGKYFPIPEQPKVKWKPPRASIARKSGAM
ncbi:hypothetical protein AX14_004118 [Amanita brunnescens Koide BX004]|nr:hypothetical protein AX14_004118 [Amanita brunnescens Koide BX004]